MALDELEKEVSTLQHQLSAAFQPSQFPSIQTDEKNFNIATTPTTDNLIDLVAAVKITLLYVQNKLSSNDYKSSDELDKLKEELLNLHDKRKNVSVTRLDNYEDELETLRQENIQLQRLISQLNNTIKGMRNFEEDVVKNSRSDPDWDGHEEVEKWNPLIVELENEIYALRDLWNKSQENMAAIKQGQWSIVFICCFLSFLQILCTYKRFVNTFKRGLFKPAV